MTSDLDTVDKTLNTFELLALSQLLSYAHWPRKTKIPMELDELIVLSDQGHQAYETIKSEHSAASKAELKVGLLLGHHFCSNLIDSNKTDVSSLIPVFSEFLSKTRILTPWMFERVLHDRFFDEFCADIERLSDAETERLLKTTPQGIVQIGSLLAGPLGILRSSERRYIPVIARIPLFHCPDAACSNIHRTNLSGGSHLSALIRDELYELRDPSAESLWSNFSNLIHKPTYMEFYQLEALPYLLGGLFFDA